MKNFPQLDGANLINLKDRMYKISIAETTSQNTYEELIKAGEIFDNKGVSGVRIVSNPDHISRCGQLAHQVYQEKKLKSLENFSLCPSEVGYNGTTNVTSKVIEMPHRGDDSSPNLSGYIGEYFKLSRKGKELFYKGVIDLLHKLK